MHLGLYVENGSHNPSRKYRNSNGFLVRAPDSINGDGAAAASAAAASGAAISDINNFEMTQGTYVL